MVRVTGIDHLVLSVGNFKASKAFYGPLMAFLGFEIEAEYEGMMGWHNDKTLFWIAAADAEGKKRKYRKGDIGFHHYAFRLGSRKDVDALVSGGPRGDHRRPGGRILRRLLRRLLPRSRRDEARRHEIWRAPRAGGAQARGPATGAG
jgi:catechol 2,3-dioxygenase-like lactoylglutathione lyase family enzyme